MASQRIRDVADNKEMDKVVDEFMVQGYRVKLQGTGSIQLKKHTWGSAGGVIVSILVAVFLTVFTLGLSWLIPIIYCIWAHYDAEEILIRIAQE